MLQRAFWGHLGVLRRPSFWSDQYDHTLLICGFITEPNSTTVERHLVNGVNLRFHLAGDGRLLGASTFGPNELIAAICA